MKCVLITAASLLIFYSCINKNRKNVTGKWFPLSVESKEVEQEDKNAILISVIEFKADGGYSMKNFMGSDTGTWRYNPSKDSLVIDGIDSPPASFSIKWQNDTLILTDKYASLKLINH